MNAIGFDASAVGNHEFDAGSSAFEDLIAQGARGYHELAAALMQGKMSYPTSVFLDENLNIIAPLPGYQTPDRLDPILEFIGGDHYKTSKYEQFLANKASLNNWVLVR